MNKRPQNSILNIPGVAEAVERAQQEWDAPFLGMPQSIQGFEVRQMTLRHLLVLRLMKSPLLTNETPKPTDVIAFLWLLNPNFTPHTSKAKKRFLKQCRAFIPPHAPIWRTKTALAIWELKTREALEYAAKLVDECRQFVVDTFEDVPPSSSTVEFEPDHYSDATSICATLAREFGWTEESILEMPLKRIFQYLNEIRLHHNPKAPVKNPTDKPANEWMKQKNARN